MSQWSTFSLLFLARYQSMLFMISRYFTAIFLTSVFQVRVFSYQPVFRRYRCLLMGPLNGNSRPRADQVLQCRSHRGIAYRRFCQAVAMKEQVARFWTNVTNHNFLINTVRWKYFIQMEVFPSNDHCKWPPNSTWSKWHHKKNSKKVRKFSEKLLFFREISCFTRNKVIHLYITTGKSS